MPWPDRHYSKDETRLSLDVALFVNGLPVATFELKNSLWRIPPTVAVTRACHSNSCKNTHGRTRVLKTSLARLLSPRSIPPNYLKEDRRDREYVEERRRQRLDHVRSNEAALRENRATSVLLYQMGKKYFGFDFGYTDIFGFYLKRGPSKWRLKKAGSISRK